MNSHAPAAERCSRLMEMITESTAAVSAISQADSEVERMTKKQLTDQANYQAAMKMAKALLDE